MTIQQQIISTVAQHGKRIFLIDAHTGQAITYAEFHSQACVLAAELRRRGLQKGDRVATMLPNSCELATLYFACIYLGAVIVPISPSLSQADVQFILRSCEPSHVIASGANAKLLKDLHRNVFSLSTSGEAIAEFPHANTIHLELLRPDPSFVPLEGSGPDNLIVIMYTSGTSSKPKGLGHRIGAMFRNASVFARAQNINEESRFYLTLSMAYMGGFYNMLVMPFLLGASVVVDNVFDARASLHFWEKAKKYEVNTLWMAPTVLSILLRMDRGRTGEEFCRNSIRHAFVGFAPLPLNVKDEFQARYGVTLIENYGLSETLFVTSRSPSPPPDLRLDRPLKMICDRGYVGEPLPGVQLRIVSDDLSEISSGIDGEIQILTPDLMSGYLDSGGRLLEMDASLWFSTGDVGHWNGSSLFVTGRKKDIIIRGGVNISPAAIEESLLQVAGVAEVAVVSIPHELYGEDIVAVIKPNLGLEFDSLMNSLLVHAKKNLAQYQQPARYIGIDEMPRTANGKVQKVRLRELVAEKLQMGPGSIRRSEEHSALSR